MAENWYKQCLPRVSDVRPLLPQLKEAIMKFPGVKSVKLFGSVAQHLNEPNYRVKDIDLIAVTSFNSEDLLAISEDNVSNRLECLEEEGIDVETAKFSKAFTRLASEIPLDHWVFSADKKLLHWGPFISDRKDSDEVKQEAEHFASKQTGFNLHRLAKTSSDNRRAWFESFRSYFQRQIGDMPTGWYLSDEEDVKTILSSAIVLEK